MAATSSSRAAAKACLWHLSPQSAASTSSAPFLGFHSSFAQSTRHASSSTSSKDKKGKGRRVPAARQLPIRKQYLLEQYQHVFTTNEVVIFLKPSDFSVAELTKLRVDLSMIPPPKASSPARDEAEPSADSINSALVSPARPRFMYIRAGLFRPVAKQLEQTPLNNVIKHLDEHGGALAALTLPTLHPPTLKAALAAVQQLSSSPNVRKLQAQAAAAAGAGGAKGKPAPPAAKAAPKQEQEERLSVIAAIIENKSIPQADLARIASLPAMEDILAQLVALIETPARNVISMTARAGGEDLARALEGFKIGLEEQQQAKEGEQTSPAAA